MPNAGRQIWNALRTIFLRRRVDDELNSELQFHLDMQVRQNIAAGMDPREARHAALRLFGGLEQHREECRDERRSAPIESFLTDVRHGVRLLAKSPGFFATAVATLALGIGINTAIFSVVNVALVRPFPFADPDRVVAVLETRNEKNLNHIPVAPGNFLDYRERSHSLTLVAVANSEFNLVTGGEPERVEGKAVSANTFDMLGIRPILGRSFRPDEDRPGAEPVLMLTYGFWKRKFGGDAGVIGRSITVDAKQWTIAGVLPPSSYSGDEQVYVPFTFSPDARNDRFGHWVGAIGRVRPGYTLQQAQSEMDVLARTLASEHPRTNTGWGVRLIPFQEDEAGFLRPALLSLLGAVALVLLIACANVSNLLLARAAPRQREMAIRTALGASRGRLIRQLLAESLLISIVGAALGLMAARWGLDALIATAPRIIMGALPFLKTVPIDGLVLAFTIFISVVVAVACSLAPALYAIRRDPQEALQSSSRGSTVGSRGQRLRGALVVAEVAIALVLLAGSGLALRSLLRLLDVHPGFNPENLLTLRLSLSPATHKDRLQTIAFHGELIRKLRTIPGVVNATTATVLPLTGSMHMTTFGIQGRETPAWKAPATQCLSIDGSYFATMGVPLLAGRSFTAQDNEQSPKVAIVNETLARTFFAGENPIGRRIMVWRESPEPREIVGIAGDVRNSGLDRPVSPDVYVPFAQNPQLEMSVVLRAGSNAGALRSDAREVIRLLDKETPVYDVRTMDELISASPTLALRRVPSLLMAIMAGAALLLAAVGIAGVMSSTVGQRTQEIGIRMALGAGKGKVLRMVLSDSLRLAGMGLAIGLPVSFALTRLMAKWLFGILPLDAPTYISVTLILLAVALLSCYVPARRAAGVDPSTALRCE